jgi:hypothetical protein
MEALLRFSSKARTFSLNLTVKFEKKSIKVQINFIYCCNTISTGTLYGSEKIMSKK